MILWMSMTESGSTPANGSSSSTKRGSAASARAISTRRRSPPDSAMPRLLRTCAMRSSPRICSSRSWRAVSVEARARLEDRHDVVFDRQLAEHRGFLRQVADAGLRALVHRLGA